MAKELLEDKIRRHVTDGFQMDYDREDNLVPVFQKEEVVENIMIALDEFAKQEAIEFAEFAVKNKYRWLLSTQKWTNPNNDLITTEQLYDLFEQSQSK